MRQLSASVFSPCPFGQHVRQWSRTTFVVYPLSCIDMQSFNHIICNLGGTGWYCNVSKCSNVNWMWLLWLRMDPSVFVQQLYTSETVCLWAAETNNKAFDSDNQLEQKTSVNSAAPVIISVRYQKADLCQWSVQVTFFLGVPPQEPQISIYCIRVTECHNTVLSNTHLTCKTHTHSPPTTRCTCKIFSELNFNNEND